tara:strand:+ start:3750 stop:3872 length:123 start_codon:yes stop_codon:yes gene_type:complete
MYTIADIPTKRHTIRQAKTIEEDVWNVFAEALTILDRSMK